MQNPADAHKPVTVKFTLSYDNYTDLSARAEKEELSLQDYIRRELFPEENTITPQDVVKRALAQYTSGETFTLPQLLSKSNEWDLPNGMAGQFGRKFNNLIKKSYSSQIRFTGKFDSKHHAIYEII